MTTTISQKLLDRVNASLITNPNGLIDKTISGTHHHDRGMYMLFSDGTFCIISPESSDYGEYSSLCGKVTYLDYSLVDAGLVSPEEYAEYTEQRATLHDQRVKESRRQQYLELKKIFENEESGNAS